MSLTCEDREWIGNLMRSEISASEERSYRRIRDGALSEVNQRLEGIVTMLRGETAAVEVTLRDGMAGMKRELGEMIGDVGVRVDQIDGELRAFRSEFNNFREDGSMKPGT